MKRKAISIRFVMIALLSVICLCSVIVAFGIGGTGVKATESNLFSEITVEEQYSVGDKVDVGKVYFSDNGEMKDATVVFVFPNGDRRKGNSFYVEEEGVYTIEARYQKNGTLYTTEKEFTVKEGQYSVTGDKSNLRYGVDESAYNTGKMGINLSLAPDEMFKYNNVIDLSKLSRAEPIIKFFLTPKTVGMYDARRIDVRLTDAYDPSIWVNFRFQCYIDAGEWARNTTYVNIDHSDCNGDHGDFGLTIGYSMYGYGNVGNETLALTVDYENITFMVNGVYDCGGATCRNCGNLRSEEAYSKLFRGFTTGEVVMTVKGADYVSNFENMVILSIAGRDLTENDHDFGIESRIVVDYQGYEEDTVPSGIVGKAYPVFDATATSVYPIKSLNKKVFVRYNEASRYEYEIRGGYFYPDTTGEYTIEYCATDAFNVQTVKTVTVNVENTGTPLELNLDEGVVVKNAYSGDKIAIARFGDEVSVDPVNCGVGVLKKEVEVLFNGKKIDIDSDYFADYIIVSDPGTYTVNYKCTDMLLQTATESYTITVVGSDTPVFTKGIKYPKYFMNNNEYVLPSDVYAYDYSDGGKPVPAVPVIVENGTEKRLDDYTYTPKLSADTTVGLYFSATNANGTTNSDTVYIPVIEVKDAYRRFVITKYFELNGLKCMPELEFITFRSTVTGNCDTTFINPVLDVSCSVTFSVNSAKNKYSAVTVSFTDSLDSSIRVNVEVVGGAAYNYVYINGERGDYVKGGFNNNIKVKVGFNADTNSITYDDFSTEVTSTCYGKEFAGFPSGKVYVTIGMKDVRETGTEFRLFRINNAPMSDETEDLVGPDIVVNGLMWTLYELGQEIVVNPAVVSDVLDQYTYGTVSVKDIDNGGFLTSPDGILMRNVAFDRAYSVIPESYGQYMIVYTYGDRANEKTYGYGVYVEDMVAPVMSGFSDTVVISAGSTLKLNGVTATDNNGDDLYMYVVVIGQNGKRTVYDYGKTVRFDKAGKYRVIYYAFDSAYNYASATVTLTVK